MQDREPEGLAGSGVAFFRSFFAIKERTSEYIFTYIAFGLNEATQFL